MGRKIPRHWDVKPRPMDRKPRRRDEKPRHRDKKSRRRDEKVRHRDEKVRHRDEKPSRVDRVRFIGGWRTECDPVAQPNTEVRRNRTSVPRPPRRVERGGTALWTLGADEYRSPEVRGSGL